MIGIFLVTHGTLGESLIQCACHVLNRRPVQLAQLGVSAADDPLDLLPTARTLLESVDSGDGALILTDLYGATPANIAGKLEALIADIEAGLGLHELGFADPQEMQDLLGDMNAQIVQLRSMGMALSRTLERSL